MQPHSNPSGVSRTAARPPDVSVVVPVANRAVLIGDLLTSLLAQDFSRERYEIVVVDNGSTDETRAIVARHPVRLLEERGSRSSYAARNCGIAESRGALVAFTDSDCIAAPDWLATLAGRAPAPGCGGVAGEVGAWEPRTLTARFLAQRRRRHVATLQHPYLPFATTANVAYRRDVLASLGGFHPTVATGGDVDLAWRMQRELGLGFDYRPAAVVHHRDRRTIAEMVRQQHLYGRGVAVLERLHPEAGVRYSWRVGAPFRRGVLYPLKLHLTRRHPLAGRTASRAETLAFAGLDLLARVAFELGALAERRRPAPGRVSTTRRPGPHQDERRALA